MKNNKIFNKKNNKKAFSAVEMSIVIAVIAILAAGIVVKKSDFLQKARTNNMIQATANSPIKELDDLVIWYDVATDDSFKNNENVDAGAISFWRNIAPDNYNDMNAVDTVGNPNYILDTKDGLPYLEFNGDTLTSERSVFGYELAKDNQITMFSVNRYYSGDNRNFEWNSTPDRILFIANFSDDEYYFDFGNNVASVGRLNSSALTNLHNQWKIVTMVKRSGGTGYIKANSTYPVSEATMSDTLDISLSSTFFIGVGVFDIRELIIFKRELSDQEILDVEEYLSKKWDIDIS